MDLKIVIIFFLIVIIVGVTTSIIQNRKNNSCITQGFIPIEDANRIINLSNKLIVAVNYCYNQTEQLPLLNYYRGIN